jgi:hypothetical protein
MSELCDERPARRVLFTLNVIWPVGMALRDRRNERILYCRRVPRWRNDRP